MEGIKIKSMEAGHISINVPAIHFKRTWANKGVEYTIPEDTFETIIYEPGVREMFENGMLYIEDMEVKKRYGLEPEDAEEPVNIIVLPDAKKRYLLTVATADGFRKQTESLHRAQLDDLVDYAIANKLTDYDKCKTLKELTGRDVVLAIKLEEDETKK